MAIVDTIKITDGTTDINLILDTDGFQMLANGAEFGVSEHDYIYHSSDYEDGERLVSEKVKNKVWPMKLAIRGDSDDAIISTLATFNKMVRQARSYHINRDVTKVYLYIKLYGASVPTYYDIIDVEYDGVSLLSYINRNVGEVLFDDGVSIKVITEPYGYGDPIYLMNAVKNPHFQEVGSDGLGVGWSKTGTPTTSLVTSPVRIPYYSQKVVADSSSEGIVSDSITAAAPNFFNGYAWVYLETAGETVTVDVYNVTSGVTIDYGEVSEEGEWVRVDVSGSWPNDPCAVRVRGTQGATFYVDQVYLNLTASAITGDGEKDSWMSCSYIGNHYDGTHINYVDTYGIKGDVPAKTRITVVNDSGGSVNSPVAWVGKRSQTTPYFNVMALDSSDGTMGTETVNASYSDGEYKTYTAAVSAIWQVMERWDAPQFGPDIDRYAGKYMLIAVGDSFDTSVYFKMLYKFYGVTTIQETPPVVGSGTDIQELGIMEIPPGYFGGSGLTFTDNEFSLEVLNTSAYEQTFIIDYLMFVPVDGYRVLVQRGYSSPDGLGFSDDNMDADSVYTWYQDYESDYYYISPEVSYGLGDKIRLDPAKRERLYFLWASSGAYSPTMEEIVTVSYRPRTEFLLGA